MHISKKEVFKRTYKLVLHSNIEKENYPTEKWLKDMFRYFIKET